MTAKERWDYYREVEALYAECDRLRETLKVFANEDNWDDGDESNGYAISVWDGVEAPWMIARAALAQTGGER